MNKPKLTHSNWHKNIVDDCKSILVQRTLRSRLELIYCYGEIGERIANDSNYNKFAHGNNEYLKILFKDIGIHERLGYRTIQFYEYIKSKCEEKRLTRVSNFSEMFESVIDIFDEGNNISFKKILTKYLTKNEKINEEQKERIEKPQKNYEILIICKSENEQKLFYDKLVRDGYNCRLIID